MEPTQGEVDAKVAAKAREYCEACRDFYYTRKDDDKKKMLTVQQELFALCPR
jgi:hypothetical protein